MLLKTPLFPQWDISVLRKFNSSLLARLVRRRIWTARGILPLLTRQCVSKPEEIRFYDGINVWDDLYLRANVLKDEVCEGGTSYEADR